MVRRVTGEQGAQPLRGPEKGRLSETLRTNRDKTMQIALKVTTYRGEATFKATEGPVNPKDAEKTTTVAFNFLRG